MNVDLLIIGRKILEENTFDFKRFFMLLSDRDYDVNSIAYADDPAVIDMADDSGAERLIVVAGDVTGFADTAKGNSEEGREYFKKGNDIYILMPVFDENIIKNTIIPLLNSRSKTCYNTVIFKTFGKSEVELRTKLVDCIKNRNRIAFSFYPDGLKCDVRIKYSKSTPSAAINDLINKVNTALADCIYALKDISLAKNVARQLMASGKKLSVAESFTGGGLAASLVSSPGMSNSLIESVVCYSSESKISRLGVPEALIAGRGAVSADTAFEMANGLLSNPHCDVAVATTGNAGPTSEKDGQVGLYYIAVGDRNAIHVFEQIYDVKNTETKSVDDIRAEITNAGIETALYELGKYLKSEIKGEI